jgi:hypothetical protein
MPKCDVCGAGPHGVQFPMTPKTEGFKFGHICADCDDKESK